MYSLDRCVRRHHRCYRLFRRIEETGSPTTHAGAATHVWHATAGLRDASALRRTRVATGLRRPTAAAAASWIRGPTDGRPNASRLQVPVLQQRRGPWGHELPGLWQGLRKVVQPMRQRHSRRFGVLQPLRDTCVIELGHRAPALGPVRSLSFKKNLEQFSPAFLAHQ